MSPNKSGPPLARIAVEVCRPVHVYEYLCVSTTVDKLNPFRPSIDETSIHAGINHPETKRILYIHRTVAFCSPAQSLSVSGLHGKTHELATCTKDSSCRTFFAATAALRYGNSLRLAPKHRRGGSAMPKAFVSQETGESKNLQSR